MSLKKYVLFVCSGVFLGSFLAYSYTIYFAKPSATRSIASTKFGKMNHRHFGKVGAPIFVQISKATESDPEKGFYKLIGHISLNQPIQSLRYQWALPENARVISGEKESNIVFAAGEDSVDQVIEIQLSELLKDSQVLFDVDINPENGRPPLGTSDTFVFRALTF